MTCEIADGWTVGDGGEAAVVGNDLNEVHVGVVFRKVATAADINIATLY